MKNGKKATTAIIIVSFLVFSFLRHAAAEVGSVLVQLNINDNGQNAVRANTITSFKVFFTINRDIKVKDWVKFWFPVDEASGNQKDICDGLPEITGDIEHPRFVPNENYFAQYPNSTEKQFGKLYEVFDKDRGLTRFDSCQCDYEILKKSKLNIIEDTSGLGCWIMGTMLPKLYKDRGKRYFQLVEICNNSALVYTPDSGVGLPLLNNTCHERSILITSPLDIEAWRKGYNPVEFNTSEKSGIMAPATPGRYRIIVATKPEPTPVESEIFVLPCSRISVPVVKAQKTQNGKSSEISIRFTTGEGGALDKDASTISIRFPKDVQLQKIKPADITTNGIKVKKITECSQEKGILSFEIQTDVSNTGEVGIDIISQSNMFASLKSGKYQIEVWTNSEPDPVKSEEFEIEST